MAHKAIVKLRDLRKSRGLTQGQTADLFGITQAQISHIESGRSDITINQAIKYAGLLGARLGDLLPADSCVND